jgi:hypothetical protein
MDKNQMRKTSDFNVVKTSICISSQLLSVSKNVVNCYIVVALAFCNGKDLCTFPFIDMFEFEL